MIQQEHRVRAAMIALALVTCCFCPPITAAEDDRYPGWHDAPDPDGPVGDAVAFGRRILTHTPANAPAYSGNALNCTSCHLDSGRSRWAAPWVGIWGVFPEYRSRNAKVNALQDRVNDCFERSLNGQPLPLESREMIGILAYMQSLWGPKSFNIGAGMARLDTAAAFVKVSMPFGQGGSLREQEAFDVAAFFTRQPRPDFAGKLEDWPKGGKPDDARY